MGFEDLGDLSELDEMPPFEEDLTLPDFDDDPGGGVSRTFKIIGAILVVLVVAIVGVLVYWALQGDDGPSPNEQTSTAIVAMNMTTYKDATNTQEAYQLTLDALAVAATASQEAVATFEYHATETQVAFQAMQTQDAVNAQQTATGEALLNQTAIAQTQTQQVLDLDLTATAIQQQMFSGQVLDETGNIFGGVTLRLYRDDGDGLFNPSEDTPAPGASEPEAAAPDAIEYGATVNETLERDAVDLWRFEGASGDIVTIEAIAGDTAGMDMFLALLGPNDEALIDDDDSGEDLNATISRYELPQDGEYTIQVSSVSGPGPYTLTLAGGDGAPEEQPPAEDDEAAQSALPQADDTLRLAQLGADTPTPIPGDGDTFITFTETDLEGRFQFEDLEPGIYWLVIDYDSLPDNLKALIPRSDELVIMVNVPVAGEVSFTVGVPPTATPDQSIFETQTALAPLAVSPETATPEVGITGTSTSTQEPAGPDMTATLEQYGLLSDIGGSTGLEGGGGLTVLAIAAAGLIAVVFVARKLRTAA